MAKSDIDRATGRVVLRRNQYGQQIAEYNDKEARERKKANMPINSDTKNRISIHTDIKLMLSEGKGKVEILTFLSNKYSDTNLSKYFEQWIEHHIQKNIRKRDDDEAR